MARRRLLIAGDGRRVSAVTNTPLSKCWRHATVQQWSMPKPDIGRKSRFLPQSQSEYCHNVWQGKLKWCGYSMVRKIEDMFLFVSTEYTNVTNRQTNGQTDTVWRHRPRLCIASRSNNTEHRAVSLRQLSFMYCIDIHSNGNHDTCLLLDVVHFSWQARGPRWRLEHS